MGGYRYTGFPIQPQQCQPTRLTGGRPSLFILGFCLRFNTKQRFIPWRRRGGGEEKGRGEGKRRKRIKRRRERKVKQSLRSTLLGASETRTQDASLWILGIEVQSFLSHSKPLTPAAYLQAHTGHLLCAEPPAQVAGG